MIERMDNNTILDDIRRSLKNNMPMGGKAFLFGSQARGTAHPGSDWDILVILNKDVLEPSDYDTITFPLTSLGWEIGENISPVMYTQKEWDSNKMTPFYKNVQRDGILLWD
ncbi:nucleotidyltransferase domain-containing protein [uncultured Prevotella sp.]|jgi:predicted nucleotidyltransferase|uniref:nucleotidyltransferase domain-containing protein n=1 Tax=uncultured Prevotella sp. TaxID=159272 RepID=UPI00259528D4|nr:nucleotidyltransferase domain-containing protein [uncultured Prevotella sp.]